MEQDLRYEHQDQPNGTGPKGRRTRTNQMEQDLKVGVPDQSMEERLQWCFVKLISVIAK